MSASTRSPSELGARPGTDDKDGAVAGHKTDKMPTGSSTAHNDSLKPLPEDYSNSLGRSLLREYASEISPQNTTSEQLGASDPLDASPPVSDTPSIHQAISQQVTAPARPSTLLQLQPPKSFLKHRKGAVSADTIPRQTIMKALASRPPQTGNLSIASSLNSLMNGHNGTNGVDGKSGTTSSQTLSAALSELALASSRDNTPAEARFPILQSPCFFHQRFDDAVNLDRVLEEIVDDEWMSHSRLMQTATGVREVSKQLQRRPIKRAVRNIMIVTKARDNQLVTLTRDVAEWLLSTPRYGSDLGVNVYVDAKLRHSKRFNAAGLLGKEPRFGQMLRYWTPDLCWTSPEKFDLVLTLGGDGTVLFTSWLFQRIVPPILSFSLGSLGFLTNFEFSKYKEHLDRVMGDAGMRVSLRMRFTCTVYRNRGTGEMEEGEQFEVLNEVVIDRGPSPYVSNLELFGDDELLTVVQADGCIFSTPTGSTAYSLSAGGSLVHPDIPAILLTPICPHTLSFRPMLLNDTMLLRVAVPAASRATAYCSFDGKGRIELRQGDHVTIAASQYPFPTVLAHPTEWFDSISRTLRWNTRAAQQKGWDEGSEEKDGGDEEGWDIDTVDSGVYSEESSSSASPQRRKLSLLV
ncbi:MAG: exosome non-catalytic core subunit rrp46 [Chaenotheca gracillima]|nr:MAG: exosome non-catalytic core subunit rrp46 [Chaenotheca gracillima]